MHLDQVAPVLPDKAGDARKQADAVGTTELENGGGHGRDGGSDQ
jgi:hypothetical protein